MVSVVEIYVFTMTILKKLISNLKVKTYIMEVSLDWKLFLSPFILANLKSRTSLRFVYLSFKIFGPNKQLRLSLGSWKLSTICKWKFQLQYKLINSRLGDNTRFSTNLFHKLTLFKPYNQYEAVYKYWLWTNHQQINMFWHDKLICISENGVIRAVHLQQPYYD